METDRGGGREGGGALALVLGASSGLRLQLICLWGASCPGPGGRAAGRWAGSLLLPLTQSRDSMVKEPEVD